MRDRVRNKFNVSAAEIGFQDKWQTQQGGSYRLQNRVPVKLEVSYDGRQRKSHGNSR
ncbi:MAG: DUF503 domain-containing protein [Candidatus Omnitrophica bacterium]|nr:DUF503 domain-containing protein [Candidatus Omnitrophota bacterium]